LSLPDIWHLSNIDMISQPDLSVDIGGIRLRNPVMTASGTFGYAREFETYVNLNRLGGIIVKGLSLAPRQPAACSMPSVSKTSA
jgi:dihydroorotate dehydrogenase